MIKKISIVALLATTSLYSNSNRDILASYNGNSGVFETPNARILNDWSMRFFLSKDTPYSYYGITMTPLPFLETNFHITQVDGVAGFDNSSGYGDYKDKSLSFKLLLNNESKYLPSIAFGVDDTWGTSLYTSKYFVFSKKYSYFDFTLGYAKGRLGGEDLSKYISDGKNSGSFNNNAINFLKNKNWSGGKPFGSVAFEFSNKLSLLAEYNQIDYSKDKVNPYFNGSRYKLPKSKFNYGLKYQYSKNSIFNLSYQRGTTLSFGYSYQFNFDRTGMFNHLPDPKWKADRKKKNEYKDLDEEVLSKKLANEIAAEKFKNVKVSVNENKIWAEINNSRYHSDLKAAGRAISTIDEVAPNYYDTIYLTLKDKELKKKTLKVNRIEFDMYENEKVSDKYMKDALVITNNVEEKLVEFKNKKEPYVSKSINADSLKYSFSPKIRTMLNHKDKAFAMKATVRLKASYYLDNLQINTAIEHPFYNSGKNLSSEPLENERLSLRSGITEHFTYNDTQLSYLSAAYINRIPYNSFFKIEIGYLEYAFAGYDLEWYKPIFNERFGIGLQYQNVYKREVDNMFKLNTDYNYSGKFLNLYALVSPKYDLHFGAKLGQFLAGDKGIKLSIARHFKNFTLGAYATYTNSKDVFENDENKGYIDKGIFLTVPLEVFTYKNVKKRVGFGLSPWTRDVGQIAGTTNSLFPISNSENNTQIMKKYINTFKE